MAGHRLAAVVMLALACAGKGQAAESVRADDARVTRMGRTVADAGGALRFGYPGVTLGLHFTGSRLAVDIAGGAGSLVDVVVDGGAPVTVRPGLEPRSITLFEGAAGAHRVELVHRTETWLGVVSVAGFATDGAFTAAPPLPARKMLVLGDSVTCGANMERGSPGRPADKNDPYWWNARVSYGMLAARALQAQVQLVCHGGRGLVRSWNGKTDEAQLPAFYDQAIADAAHPVPWRQADYDPDLVLVAIGTNDFTTGIPERESYVAAYTAFVRTLLKEHAHARIALTEGAILNGEKKQVLRDYLHEVAARVASPLVQALPSEHHPGDALDAHPTTPQHAAMAQELVPRLRKLMGW
jgi:lysophospholipase L1-like esterase